MRVVDVGDADLGPSLMTGRPGLPTTVVLAGTSCTTTLPAPILTLSPTVMEPSSCDAGPDDHVVAHGGVPLARLLAGAAQGDALVDGDVLAHLGGLADDHPDAVVDEEALAQGGPRMDLDPGEEPPELGDQPRQHGTSRFHSACAARWNHSACSPG